MAAKRVIPLILLVAIITGGVILTVTSTDGRNTQPGPEDRNEQPDPYIVYVDIVDSEPTGNYTTFANMSDVAQGQFRAALSEDQTYESKPEIMRYHNDRILYDGQVYRVGVLVA